VVLDSTIIIPILEDFSILIETHLSAKNEGLNF